ncbi:hypothetical protein FRC01_007936, partial [Tulasnella sp. 417]
FTDGDGERTDYSPGFQSLVHSKIWAPFTSALAITRAITSSCITALDVTVNNESIESPTSLFETIATMTPLNALAINFFKSDSPQWQDVELLFSLPLIVDFSLSIGGPGMELEDELISAISRAWPNLIHLRLTGSEDPPESFARPSLRGLAVLLAGCPKLQDLHLEIDASARQLVRALADSPPTSSEPRGKLKFNVQKSPIAQNLEESIADYLWALWPGEWDVSSWWRGGAWQGDTWERVHELLQEEE